LQQQYFAQAPQVAQQQLSGLQGIANSQAPLNAMYQYGQRYANDVITPNVLERFAGLGAADSGGAARGLARELGTYGLGLSSQIGQAGLQNQAQQLQAYGQMGQVPAQLGLAGAQQYDITNAQLGAQQQQYLEGQPYNNPWYNIGGSLLGQYQQPVQQGAGMGYSALGGLLGSTGVGNFAGAGLSKLFGL
jgi:hypothetical protein